MKSHSLQLVWLGLLGLASLNSCSPQQTQVKSIPTSLESRGQDLVEQFRPVLAQAGIAISSLQIGKISKNSQDGLSTIVQAFYSQAPGFCPLQDVPFYTSNSGTAFMVVTAKIDAVKVLIYDNSQLGSIYFVTLTGQTKKPLSVRRC